VATMSTFTTTADAAAAVTTELSQLKPERWMHVCSSLHLTRCRPPLQGP